VSGSAGVTAITAGRCRTTTVRTVSTKSTDARNTATPFESPRIRPVVASRSATVPCPDTCVHPNCTPGMVSPRTVSATARSTSVSCRLVSVSTLRAGSSPIRGTTPRMLTVSANVSGSATLHGRTCSTASPRPSTSRRPAESTRTTLSAPCSTVTASAWPTGIPSAFSVTTNGNAIGAPCGPTMGSVSRSGVTLNVCVTRGGLTTRSCTHCIPARAIKVNRAAAPARRRITGSPRTILNKDFSAVLVADSHVVASRQNAPNTDQAFGSKQAVPESAKGVKSTP